MAQEEPQQLLAEPHLVLVNKNNPHQYVVSGKYEYHHYLQDNFDDRGWGCAYRSLQTIYSWFIHNTPSLLTDKNKIVPLLPSIQLELVNLEDKPKSFVGVCTTALCIDVLVKAVDCKIIYCNSGSEVLSKVPEFVNHFKTQKTPIMIGGDGSALTLMGVEYDGTNPPKFLILDPHYIGQENLDAVKKIGAISWQSENIFSSSQFYNFCLPQVPKFLL